MCAHRQAVYAKEPWLCLQGGRLSKGESTGCGALVESELAQDNCLSLPIFPQMTDEELKYVAKCLLAVL